MRQKRLKILLGYDGSEHSETVLEDLRRAGLPTKAKVVVLCAADVVTPSDLPPESESAADRSLEFLTRRANIQRLRALHQQERMRAAEALATAKELAARASERVKSLFPAWEVRAEAGAGSPATLLLKRAQRWQADLIVVGSQGRSAIARFFLGSVSQKVLAETQCAVRVARRRHAADDAPVRIMIGLDGSENADAAVRHVAARAWPAGSEVCLLAAYDLITPGVAGRAIPAIAEWTEERNEEEGVWVNQVVRAAQERLEAVGLTVSTLVQPGDPKEMLVAEAERWGVDCIFVGARGVKGLERLLLGSVSSAVAARASCSVEVVRAINQSEK